MYRIQGVIKEANLNNENCIDLLVETTKIMQVKQ